MILNLIQSEFYMYEIYSCKSIKNIHFCCITLKILKLLKLFIRMDLL